MSFHVFLHEGVDLAVYETHKGGEFDQTNVIAHPVVTAITPIGIDHIATLGPSIENIAWHKAGVFEVGAAALSICREPAVAEVLNARAAEKGVMLKFVGVDHQLPGDFAARVQRLNRSLAREVADAFLARMSPGQRLSREDIVEGMRQFSWPGRFQTIHDGRCTWFLDGAHNELSVREAAE